MRSILVVSGREAIFDTQRATYLWVEEIENGEEATVYHGKEQISSPADSVNHDWGDHDNEEVEEPVGTCRNSVCLRACLDGTDLGRVEPRKRKPSSSKRGDVSKETDGSSLGRVGISRNQACKSQDHGKHLAGRSPEEKLPASNSLNDEPGHGGKGGVDNHVDTAEQHGHVVRLANGVLEQDGEVVDDGVAATDLLHELGRSAEQHASEVLRLAVGEEGLDGSALLTGKTRGSDGIENDVSLRLGLFAVDFISAEGGNGSLSLLISLMCEEPSRTVRKPDHCCAEEQGEGDLESNGESPNQVVRPV